jgi:hypothetical protein
MNTVIELFPCAYREGRGRNGGSAPFILAGWMLLVNFILRVLYLRRTPHPITHLTGGRVAAGAACVALEKRSISYPYFLVVQPLA